ncbi:TetR/AcrR family transcriptional regulator [Actinomadura kijaniata]|uniref:TetR/AcrR family transcriptional regulator n=1 Tax=Actinomadura kijaniata TaxID=46161 RepID=UPI000837143C|nr:TetR/AcrR family transcriptional regulator [Actinomadura kijaniata]
MFADEVHDMRTRNKQATREAISAAALRLALEKGPEGLALVRVRDIAEAAGVAPRTYNNYFSSREEAICAFQADQARRLGRALSARPAGEPLDEAVVAAAIEVFADPEPDRGGLKMIMSTPSLQGEALKAFAMAEEPLALAIAERVGDDADELRPAVLAAAVAGAVRVAGRHWLDSTDPQPFAEVLDEALRQVLRPGTLAPSADRP